jgi:hypothetical protein
MRSSRGWTGSGHRGRRSAAAAVPDEELPIPAWMAQALARYIGPAPRVTPRRAAPGQYGACRRRPGPAGPGSRAG